jgi:hypothetical protein
MGGRDVIAEIQKMQEPSSCIKDARKPISLV